MKKYILYFLFSVIIVTLMATLNRYKHFIAGVEAGRQVFIDSCKGLGGSIEMWGNDEYLVCNPKEKLHE